MFTGFAIYTAGHYGATPRAVFDWCQQKVPVTLVDIRLMPLSKSPEWNGKALAERFGPRYLHLPAWGKSPTNEIIDFDRGWSIVSDLRQRNRVLLLCECADEATCHRGILRAMLEKRNIQTCGVDAVIKRYLKPGDDLTLEI